MFAKLSDCGDIRGVGVNRSGVDISKDVVVMEVGIMLMRVGSLLSVCDTK